MLLEIGLPWGYFKKERNKRATVLPLIDLTKTPLREIASRKWTITL